MALARFSVLARNAKADALATFIDLGAGNAIIEFYDGTMPTTPETALGAQVKLGTLTFADPAVTGAAAAGVITFGTITGDSAADASGTATWARITNPTTNIVVDLDVGTSGAAINMDNNVFVLGGTINVGSLTYTEPM